MQKVLLILIALTAFWTSNIFCALSHYTVEMRVLVLSDSNDESTDFGIKAAKKFLRNFGIPFDYMNITDKGVRRDDFSLDLINSDGSGKYYGIVTTSDSLALTAGEWEQLHNYQRDFKVRRVSLYSTPTESLGVKLIPNQAPLHKSAITLNSEFGQYQKGLTPNLKIPLEGVWYYPTKIINERLAKPVAYFAENAVAGVEIQTEDEREELHLFFQPATFARVNIVFSTFWIQWLTKNIYVGQRRIYLTAQVDDWFLANNLWNPETESETWNGVYAYRTTPHDMDQFIEYQNAVLRPLSLDPNYKIELAFNGFGIKEHGGESDPLFLKSRELKNEFYWVSHTFSHFNLDHLTYDQMVNEIRENIVAAKSFLADAWDMFTENAIVTPEISGLFNPQVLQALQDEGIDYVIGDNSIDKLMPLYPHIGKYTTKASNGVENLLIIPRNAIEVDFNLSLPSEMESQFNKMNEDRLGDKLDLKSIMQLIAVDATNDLMNYDHAPFMFHQANLRFFSYENGSQSLITLWLTQIMQEVRKYSDLPILSAQYKELIKLYKNRMSFDKCNPIVKLEISNSEITAVTVAAKSSCTIPITGLELTDSYEVYGPDKTDHIAITKSSLTFFPNHKQF